MRIKTKILNNEKKNPDKEITESLCIFTWLTAWPDDVITDVTDHEKVITHEITLY